MLSETNQNLSYRIQGTTIRACPIGVAQSFSDTLTSTSPASLPAKRGPHRIGPDEATGQALRIWSRATDLDWLMPMLWWGALWAWPKIDSFNVRAAVRLQLARPRLTFTLPVL